MVTVRAVAVTGDLSANISSQGFTMSIFDPQKAGVTLAAPVLAPTGSSKKPRSSWVQASQPKSSGCSGSMSDKTPDSICKRKPTGLANLALRKPWTKPHSLGPHLLGLAALWFAQRHKMEDNDCSAMKSSQGVTSARFWLHKPKRRYHRGREMEGWHHWRETLLGCKKPLKYFSKLITEAWTTAEEKHINKTHCTGHKGLIT